LADTDLESLEDFQLRARAWIRANLVPASGTRRSAEETRQHDAELQARIFDAGFAGLPVPKAYGGQGLTIDHQRVWALETAGFDTPTSYFVSIGMMLPTLLDHGSEAVKKRHIPRMLRGEEAWIQLLSEPSSGSDMAGALTRATPVGNGGYLLNGSKMWSSGAGWSHYGICLARVDWNVPKHQGLGMFAVNLKGEGVTIAPITPVAGGQAHQFIEYLDNVRVDADYVLAGEGMGWTVAQRLLFHERNANAGIAYGYGLGGGQSDRDSRGVRDALRVAARYGSLHDQSLRDVIVDDHIDGEVRAQLAERVAVGLKTGKLQGHWGSLLKLGQGIDGPIRAEAALAVAGADGVIWAGENQGGEPGNYWLQVRGPSIAGGSNEIQRNIISERLMGLPREPGQDNSRPFNELAQND
jgi:alkylation response protein AidB-like acyl-CoA dehydrogenase